MDKIDRIFCDKCENEIGYVIFTRWIDYNMFICMDCMNNILKDIEG